MIDHPYPLRRIQLRNFKSVAEADVRLAPLTVVVGANSAGKSTLIQSILALSQAVRSENGTAEFPLNGEFVRLGTFEETYNFLAKTPDAPMEIAFELVEHRTRRPRRMTMTEQASRGREGFKYSWRARLTPQDEDGTKTSGFARLQSLEVEISTLSSNSDDDSTLELTCDISQFGIDLDENDGGRPRFGPMVHGPFGLSRLSGPGARRSLLSAEGRVADWVRGGSTPIDVVSLSGCLPVTILRRQKRFDWLADLWWDTTTFFLADDLDQERAHLNAEAAPKPTSHKAVKVAAQQISRLLDPRATEEDDSPRAYRLRQPEDWLLFQLDAMNPEERQELTRSLAHIEQPDFRKSLQKEITDNRRAEEIQLVDPPGKAGDLLLDFSRASHRTFSDSIRYLGPLREAPHVFYDPGSSKLDLGISGEFSAAVLHAQAKTEVFMPTPTGAGSYRPLGEALNFWLQEFGLADHATANDQGRMGISLSVTPTGLNRDVDLTSVGVGVSQVLPVILLCLLAGSGTIIVLEQPELHLHPKLQQDLADFLLACTRAGRQLVIETHSEHLVNRLRYRVAEDETDETHQLIQLVFAENDGGVTSYREPVITEYGGLGDDWPAGFLDLTARESQDLVRKALAKRKRYESEENH